MSRKKPLTAYIGFLVTEATKKRVWALAEAAGRWPSEWVRETILKAVEDAKEK